jgi:taurine dioxygenase
VIWIRGQNLSDPDLIAFGKRFGELEPPGMSIIGKPYLDDYPDVLVISNLKAEDGTPLGNLGDGEAIWHTDMSYRDTPVSAAILHAWEVPPSGGDTSFANQYLAYETLPGALRSKIDGRQMVHDETYNSAGQIRKGFEEVTNPQEAPGARHPIVRTHPVSGRKCLYLGRRRNGYILGLELEDSEETLDRLWDHATQPSLTWTHRWRKGDVLIWDNQCVLHRRDSFDPASRRMMHRVQVKGERPA